MNDIMAIAEYVEMLQAICVKCGNPASRVQRLVNGHPAKKSDPLIVVGNDKEDEDSIKYEARCRACFELPE